MLAGWRDVEETGTGGEEGQKSVDWGLMEGQRTGVDEEKMRENV